MVREGSGVCFVDNVDRRGGAGTGPWGVHRYSLNRLNAINDSFKKKDFRVWGPHAYLVKFILRLA